VAAEHVGSKDRTSCASGNGNKNLSLLYHVRKILYLYTQGPKATIVHVHVVIYAECSHTTGKIYRYTQMLPVY
jgi:hypothetical protein